MDTTDNVKLKVHLQDLPLDVKLRLREPVLYAWYKNPGTRSREFDLTQEERDYLGRFVRWYRSLRRLEPPERYGPGALIYKGKPDPAFNYIVEIKRTPDHSEPYGSYMQPRGFLRPYPAVVLPYEYRQGGRSWDEIEERLARDKADKLVVAGALKKWYSRRRKPSRQLDLTAEERQWLSGHLRRQRRIAHDLEREVGSQPSSLEPADLDP